MPISPAFRASYRFLTAIIFLWLGGALEGQVVPTVTSARRLSAETVGPTTDARFEVTVRVSEGNRARVRIYFSDTVGGSYTEFEPAATVVANAATPVVVRLPIRQTLVNGRHTVRAIAVSDAAGRETEYVATGQVLTTPAEASGVPRPHTLDFASLSFTVAGALSSVVPPRLVDLFRSPGTTFEPGSVAEFSVEIAPGNTGPYNTVLTLEGPDNTTVTFLHPDPASGRFRFVVSDRTASGLYRLSSVVVGDPAGRGFRYNRDGTLNAGPWIPVESATHRFKFSDLDVSVRSPLTEIVRPRLTGAVRVGERVLRHDDAIAYDLTFSPASALVLSIGIEVVGPDGLSRLVSAWSSSAALLRRAELRIPESWPNGSYRVQRITLQPEFSTGINYYRPGTAPPPYLVASPPPADLNWDSLDFVLERRPPRPTIIAFPAGTKSLALGTSAVWTVMAEGLELAYQWFKDGVALPGATGSTLVIREFREADEGSYTVSVTNAGGSTVPTSPIAAHLANPRLLRQPAGSASPMGEAFVMHVQGAGDDVVYSWFLGPPPDRSRPVATGPASSLKIGHDFDDRTYWVEARNSYGVAISQPLVVPGTPSFVTVQPKPWITSSGSAAIYRFSVGVAGPVHAAEVTASLDGVDVSNRIIEVERNVVPGTTPTRSDTLVDFTLQMSGVRGSDAGLYRFHVKINGATHPLLATIYVPLEVRTTGVPIILSHPVSTLGRAGSTLSLAVEASPAGTVTYQWRHNRTRIIGAIAPTMTLTNLNERDVGFYDVIVSGPNGAVLSFPAAVTLVRLPGRLVNLSLRATVSAAEPAIVGVGVVGPPDGRQPVLIRGIGPALSAFNVPGALADPALAIYSARGELIAENDNWGGAPAIAAAGDAVGAFPLRDLDGRDAALLRLLETGATTIHLTSPTVSPGEALLELYSTSPLSTEGQRMTNLSARLARVTGGTVIVGFTVAGDQPLPILLRAVGPTLALFGVRAPSNDPRLRIVAGDGREVAANDDWPSNDINLQQASVRAGAFPLGAGSRDAARMVTLPPGTASVIVEGPPGDILVELYTID